MISNEESSVLNDFDKARQGLIPVTYELVREVRNRFGYEQAEELRQAHLKDMKKAGRDAFNDIIKKDYRILKHLNICIGCRKRPTKNNKVKCERCIEIHAKSRRESHGKDRIMDRRIRYSPDELLLLKRFAKRKHVGGSINYLSKVLKRSKTAINMKLYTIRRRG